MSQKGSLTLRESAQATSSENDAAVDLPGTNFSAYLDVTAAPGTGTLDVDIEAFNAQSGSWFVVASFAQASAVTSERITASNVADKKIRAANTLAGASPDFTWSVSLNYAD